MRIPRTGRNQSLLGTFRTAGPCEVCGKWCRVREPHHLACRGTGGGSTLDIRINLIAVGATRFWCCPCHNLIGSGHITKEAVLEIVARREGLEPQTIVDRIHLLQRMDKDAEVPSWV